MLIKEYRIPMPLSVDEYQRGQLYSVSEASKNETGGGEGVQVVKQEAFNSDKVKPGTKLSGMYTYKIYGLKSKMPWIFRKLLPEEAMELHEESWNAHPYCKTVVTNPGYMKGNFQVIIESVHLADNGSTENALGMDKSELKKREVVMLDIYSEEHLMPKDTTETTDPRTFKSKKTGRGPLAEGWQEGHKPLMCCYKLCRVNFKWFGLQTKVEKSIHKNYPRLFVKFHRDIFIWIDDWYELTLEQIRKIELETAEQLKKQIKEGEVRGMRGGSAEERSVMK
ncbi:unnamed protein product [Bursaphelenchus okinawaensis]|uniref:Phosphatidylinositol transfer protein N-terminal domain-containing protein n=1 Tax=Bursaphelenchus okinawaensis TaxID=465554 RepID=A0A811KE26_9BILA|nr:unnamed protein product [Bursaphelenchus okinawaensis]CAG9102034.1 unnamed protein product [Bursaphelenchus okinawaensis]